MVELGEGVDEQLPVRADVGPVLVDLGHLVEGIAGDARAEIPQVLAHRGRVVGIEVDEDEPLPRVDRDGGQPVVLGVEVEELRLLLHEGQLPFHGVTPAVVLAGELPAGATRLLARVVVPDQLVATVAAHVVEGADAAVGTADDDNGGPGGVELLGEVAARNGAAARPGRRSATSGRRSPCARARSARRRWSPHTTRARCPTPGSARSNYLRWASRNAPRLSSSSAWDPATISQIFKYENLISAQDPRRALSGRTGRPGPESRRRRP